MVRLVVDCSCLCYKALYTMGDLSENEQRVGVIFGFVKQIFSLAKKFETNRFVFCWDSRNSYRKLYFPEYKNKRRTNLNEGQLNLLQDAFRQFDEIQETLLPMMGFKNSFHQSGYEADDLIAHVVMRFPDDTVIVSTDNDLLQLIYHSRYCPIKVYNYKGITDLDTFKRCFYGLEPTSWAEIKAIAGCNSDNVPGLEGVGEITAARFLTGELSGKKADRIKSEDGQAIIKRNRPLVTLPYSLGKKEIKISELYEDEISLDKFKMILGQYGFRSLIKEDEVSKWSSLFFKKEE